MRWRFEGRSPHPALDMTRIAVPRDATRRQSCAVTTCALHFYVRTLQYKTRRIMVEARGCLRE
jgi:hypothetical protein